MKVLVTGGAGFTGVHLVRALVARGDEVIVLDRAAPAAEHPLDPARVRVVEGALEDSDAIDRAIDGVEIVFNLASAFRDIHGGAPPFRRTDLDGTSRLFGAAVAHGVRRVVHCSTQGVHGSLSSAQLPADEDAPFAPLDTYCRAKVRAEEICARYRAEGLDVVIVRPTSIYGPGDTHGWLRLFQLVRSGTFLMIGSGDTHNHPVFVEDVVRGLMLAAETPAARNRTYLIGGERYVTLETLVKTIAEVQGVGLSIRRFPWFGFAYAMATVAELVTKPLGVVPILFRRRLNWFRTERGFDISRAREELGYEPRVSLHEGLERTFAWYVEHRFLAATGAREASYSRSLPHTSDT